MIDTFYFLLAHGADPNGDLEEDYECEEIIMGIKPLHITINYDPNPIDTW